MATAEEIALSAGPPRLLCVGFFRTGTASLGAALGELGFQNVFHGLNSVDKPSHWDFFERAALAKWPGLLIPKGRPCPDPFTRDDWDELFAPYDALTDFSCLFAPELIAAYPEAKVILTERDVERWYTSFEATVLACLFSPGVDWFLKGVGTIVGHRAGFAMQKALTGYFGGARNIDDFRRVARRKYLAHYDHIKRIVPPENLLVYKVGKDGWEPLCEFLGKPVPDMTFPFVNEGQAYDALLRGVYRRYLWKAARIMTPYIFVVLLILLLWYYLGYN